MKKTSTVNVNGKIDAEVNAVLQAMGVPVEGNDPANIETNANEVHHTTNTGFGAELIPDATLSDEVIRLAIEESYLLPLLPGNHGTGLNISEKVPVIGALGKFAPNSEWKDDPATAKTSNRKLATSEVTIDQGQFIITVHISKRMLNYARTDLEAYIKRELATSMSETVDALILNGDPETGATGNVNKVDGAPSATTDYYLEGGKGARRIALVDDTASGVDLGGTIDRSDFTSLENKLGRFFKNGKDCIWISDRKTYNKITTLDDFSDASKRGEKSTITGQAVANIDGADFIIVGDSPLTKADGTVSATPANNVKGALTLLWKPAVQYGFGQPLEYDVTKIPGKGIAITATFEFGFAFAHKLAGQTDSSVAYGYNVAV